MRGGSESQFDGDIILFTKKEPDYKDNYIFADKNRYNSLPLDELKLNIFSGKLMESPAERSAIADSPVTLSFTVTERNY